jgi:hypothetical protein
MLNVVMLNVFMLNIIRLSIVLLSVIMLRVVAHGEMTRRQNDAAPKYQLKTGIKWDDQPQNLD